MHKYLLEMAGTALLIATIGCVSITPAAGNLSPLAIGLLVPILFCLVGVVSGAHFNPAVTLAMKRLGRLDAKDFTPYLIFQLLGAGLGVVLVKLIKRGYTAPLLQPITLPALLAEFVFCFLLVYTFLHVTGKDSRVGLPVQGAMLGAAYLVGFYAVGNVSGGLINPASNLGAIMLGMLPLKSIWIYLLADFGAAWAASEAFKRLQAFTSKP
jgi:aquaporin Z